MKKIYFIILLLLLFIQYISSQETDTTTNIKTVVMGEVVVSATRTERNIEDIPAQVDVIGLKAIEQSPVNTIDDILKSVANVYVNRSWGIFSKNSSVTMRGLEGSARSLIMVDGVPKNKISGGSVNWHNINPDNIEKIEVIKGPSSALYGNNAMGGVINIITKKPDHAFEGLVKTFGGSYKTFGGSTNLMASNIKDDKGFYWGVNGFYRQGDGYIFEPLEFLDETDVETYLQEYGGGTKLGYQFNKKHNLELVYDFYNEKRGGGRQVFEEDGSFDKFITNQVKVKYDGNYKKSKLKALFYYNYEDYGNQKESLNSSNEYRLSHANTYKNDKGAWLTWSKRFFSNHYITFGGEVKQGNVIGNEIYRTAPDVIDYSGYMRNYALFVQDEINLFNDKVKVIAGIRNDLIRFYNGQQEVQDPSKVTGFPESFTEEFKTNSWNSLNPKVAIQYSTSKTSNIYFSYSTGIKPPKLDDLCKSGKIRKGFRLANPNLKPETLTNYEIGFNSIFTDKIILNSAVYYSIGNDFHYLVGTGDSIDTGGSSLKPILYRENVTKIKIIGGELSINYKASKNLSFNLNYSYNNSTILDYDIDETNPSKDLSGLYIVEVSPHLVYADIRWKNKFFSTNINGNYTDDQWGDDENTILIEDYFIVNAKFSKRFKNNIGIYIDLQNIFDVEYVDRKGQMAPGLFIIGGLIYNFKPSN